MRMKKQEVVVVVDVEKKFCCGQFLQAAWEVAVKLLTKDRRSLALFMQGCKLLVPHLPHFHWFSDLHKSWLSF